MFDIEWLRKNPGNWGSYPLQKIVELLKRGKVVRKSQSSRMFPQNSRSSFYFKVYLTPPHFFPLKLIHLLFQAFKWKHFLIWLNLDFLCRFKVALEVLHHWVSGSLGRRLLMTSTQESQEPNTMAPWSAPCIWSRKMENKTNRSNVFWGYNVQVLFQNYFFFVTGVRVEFQLGRLRNKLRACSTTVNSLLGARRAYVLEFTGDDWLIVK